MHADITKETWCTPREDLQGDRKPGLIYLSRPMLALGVSGIHSLLNAPLALTPADLKAGGVEVALMGVPADVSYARRGSSWGPRMIRNSGDWYPAGFTMVNDSGCLLVPLASVQATAHPCMHASAAPSSRLQCPPCFPPSWPARSPTSTLAWTPTAGLWARASS